MTMADDSEGAAPRGVSRRNLLRAGGVSAALPLAAVAGAIPAEAKAPGDAVPVVLKVNGRDHRIAVDPRTTVLDALRERIGMTGSKKGCDQGQCGACTVLIDGRRVLGCLTLAVVADGRPITTIEGLAEGDQLHPMQQAFIDHDAFQCGYCTPGQILSAVACVHEGHARSDADIREYMSGNLCRCAAYPNIVAAVRQGRDKMAQERG
jgi:xanthine dehydrogenase YagT iron-sulfur-binding subunit